MKRTYFPRHTEFMKANATLTKEVLRTLFTVARYPYHILLSTCPALQLPSTMSLGTLFHVYRKFSAFFGGELVFHPTSIKVTAPPLHLNSQLSGF